MTLSIRGEFIGHLLNNDKSGSNDVPCCADGTVSVHSVHMNATGETSYMNSSDPYSLGYENVDDNPDASVLIANMDATSRWEATRRLRTWERDELGLTEGERLLDVGCGPGDAALSLATLLGPTGELVGVDASAAMLKLARQRSAATVCAVRFSVGDARSLNEADGSFDVVRSERTLQWLPDPGSAVSEFARVLRSRGRLSLIDTDWSTLHLDVAHPEITVMVRRALETERNRPSNIGRRLTHLAEAAGFEVVATATATQNWTDWNPDETPAPDGCFSMQSLTDDLVDAGELESNAKNWFVDTVLKAARYKRFEMSLTMHGLIAVRP